MEKIKEQIMEAVVVLVVVGLPMFGLCALIYQSAQHQTRIENMQKCIRQFEDEHDCRHDRWDGRCYALKEPVRYESYRICEKQLGYERRK